MRESGPRRSAERSEDRLESLLKPYRDLSNAQIVAVWEEYAAQHTAGPFPSTRTMRENARLFTGGKRYRYALALVGYRLLTGEPPSRGLERAATWVEWYHLYTLFLDDIMDEDVRRRTVPSAWATNAKLYRGADANRPAVVFRTRRHRYGASQAILDALRLRSLAERAIEGAVDLPPAVRLELLSELTRMSEAKTGRLYLGAAATAAIAAGASSEDRAALESFAHHFAIAFQDRDDLLGAGVVASRIGGSSEGDIRQGKRTRLYVLAMERLRPADRAAFSRAYGRGPRTTRRDVAAVRGFLRAEVLEETEKRIADHIEAAKRDLDRLPSKDPEARSLLEALLDAQRSRER
ncbi:MAG: hypothetical protein E6K14_03995 [Methanobacteriota archaeon]|nr:MAG: hypothetical protein E6K14_03995 [Euryarchaeota archaeon]